MHLLFVCTGNTCRSPMAAALAERAFAQRQLDWTADSAGLYAAVGHPMAKHAVQALRSLGVDPAPHAARQITAEMVAAADLVLAMTSAHAWDLRAAFPQAFDKIYTLGGFARAEQMELSAACDIVDPFGGSGATYAACAAEIAQHVNAALAKLDGRMDDAD